MKIIQPGSRQSYRKDVVILLIAFALSRVWSEFFRGIHLKQWGLGYYWQILDVDTLKHHLLKGLWYDHAQPPFFNLVLGLVLKISGDYSPIALVILFKGISLVNCFLILAILRRVIPSVPVSGRPTLAQTILRNSPLLIALFYLLSPGLIIFESDVLYTTFISMILLIGAFFVVALQNAIPVGQVVSDNRDPAAGSPARPVWKYAAGIFISVAILCLTRSMYHLLWLIAISLCMLFAFKKTIAFRPVLICSFLSLLLVTGWYAKNYAIFGQFSTSSWLGMNLSRTVFHFQTKDSAHISTIESFSDLKYYHGFIDTTKRKAFAGLDDQDLLYHYKNDTAINYNNIDYIDISRQYMAACKDYIKKNPVSYLGTVFKSCITFFAPSTRYYFSELETKKIEYYDLIYSFNFTHFAKDIPQRKLALTVSAIPKLCLYLCVFFLIGRDIIRRKRLPPLNLFIICTIGYVFFTSSLVEHYENMRFRFEIEPLYLILLGQALLLIEPFKTTLVPWNKRPEHHDDRPPALVFQDRMQKPPLAEEPAKG